MSHSNNSKMEMLLSAYKRHLLLYKAELEATWEEAHKDTRWVHHVTDVAHKLSGSGKAYGFVELSQLARELECACEAAKSLNQQEIKYALSEPLNALLNALARYSALPSTVKSSHAEESSVVPTKDDADKIDILLVDDDPDFSMQISEVLSQYGYCVYQQKDIYQLNDAIIKHEPLALLVDMDFSGQRFAGANQVSIWRQKSGAPLPVFFVSGYDTFELRLASVRAGGTHYLRKPLDVPKLVSLLHSELNLAPREPYRILLVDDDCDLLNLYGEFLTNAGYTVTTVTSAEEALQTIEKCHPELILIDVYMPECSGIELGKIIRQHEEFATIPLLFMSASADTDMQLACARLANDEFINKPIELWRLLMVVKSRVTKGRYLRSHTGSLTTAETHILQDSLTALPMLASMRRDIEDALRNKAKNIIIAVFKIDIRAFHTINNLHGHYFGDEVLQRVAWELNQYIQPVDKLYRESGDEFLVLAQGCSQEEQLRKYVLGLMSLIENINIITKYGNLALSADIGVACYSQDVRNSEELIDHADMAIFKAKTSPGAEVHFFDGSLKECQKERYFLERAIKQGLYNNQFVVFYQPIFTVCNGEPMGMEALARWQHPDKGLLGPGEFIPLMEEQGLVSQLTEQVMAQALCQLSYWHHKQPSLFMSFNLSARDIQKPIFLNRLASLIEFYQLPPSCVVLEITESLLLFDWPQANHLLQELKKLGVRLALDDFGTGYSSLSYLQRIDAEKLKIDKSFIHQWSLTGDSRLLKAMIDLGRSMNMSVVVEGVETKQELNFLKEIGCDQYQGFLTAKPMPAKAIEENHWI